MQLATIENFSDAYLDVKRQGHCVCNNIFLDGAEIQSILTKKKCFLYKEEDSLFLLIPYHNNLYYDCLYLARNLDSMSNGIQSLCNLSSVPDNLRISIIGKCESIEATSAMLQQHGFKFRKKILRMQSASLSSKMLAAMRSLAAGYEDKVSFAVPDDAEEIYDLLAEYFDIVGDNIPEIETIRENIEKGHVIVLRHEGKIISLHYFTINRNTMFGLYDVTRKEYRKDGAFMAVALFKHDYFASQNIKCNRALAWRNLEDIKIISHANQINEYADGVCIYYMLRSANAK